jgi:hypothetical protein
MQQHPAMQQAATGCFDCGGNHGQLAYKDAVKQHASWVTCDCFPAAGMLGKLPGSLLSNDNWVSSADVTSQEQYEASLMLVKSHALVAQQLATS